VWTPLAPVQTLVRTSPDSCRGTADEPPLTLSATKRLMHRSKEILFISSFGPIKPRQWNGKVERLRGLQVDNLLASWSRHRPFGSEKVLGRETIIKTDAMPEKNCKT